MKGTCVLMSATEMDSVSTALSLMSISAPPMSEGAGPVYLGKEKQQIWWVEEGRRETREGTTSFFSYKSAKRR